MLLPFSCFIGWDFVMANEYHITRAASWDADSDPVTIEEVEQMAELLPPGFQIDWEGVLEQRTPWGIETESIGPCLFYQDYYAPEERIYVRFQGEAPRFALEDPTKLEPFVALADLLNAAVQDDDGRIYS